MTGLVQKIPFSSATYLPAFTLSTLGDLSVAYTVQLGEYTMLGNMVCFTASVAFTPTYTTATGNASISTPFTNGPVAAAVTIYSATDATIWPVGTTQMIGQIVAATSVVRIQGQGSAVSGVSFTNVHFVSGTAYALRVSGCYFVS